MFLYLGRLQDASAWCPGQNRPRFPVGKLENHYLPDLGHRGEGKEKLRNEVEMIEKGRKGSFMETRRYMAIPGLG